MIVSEKRFFIRILFFLIFSLGVIFFCSADIPFQLGGIWEGSDRYVLFSDYNAADIGAQTMISKTDGDAWLNILLKTFYGWYADRASEPASFAATDARTVNDTTAKEAEHIVVRFIRLSDVVPSSIGTDKNRSTAEDSGAWNLEVRYGKQSVYYIPVAVINNKLYLDFILKKPLSYWNDGSSATDGSTQPSLSSPRQGSFASVTDISQQRTIATGFWQGILQSTGINISPFQESDSIVSYYVTSSVVYRIRYWKTDMDYQSDKVSFSDGSATYLVPRHIICSGQTFTCVTGRSTIVRTVNKLTHLQNTTIDSSGTICAFGTPYLTLKITPGALADYMRIVADSNSRRKPPLPPPFPPSNIDWHWDEINYLEKNNPLIQAVRQRQKEFAAQQSGK